MKINYSNFLCCFALCIASLIASTSVNAQPYSLTKEEVIKYTPMWKGERFPDGRPKVSDEIIERMKFATISDTWAFLRGYNDPGARPSGGFVQGSYSNQYYGGFKRLFDDVTICGRASTIQFMPYRPDVNIAIQEDGKKAGKANQITWGIDYLLKGDVYVANVCEGILDASHVGDNLGTTIWTRSGNGAIIRGTVRDTEGNMQMKGFNLFVRDFRPEPNSGTNMVIGINGPIQIGYVTVMPGDIVLAKFEGVIFIPPHLAEELVIRSEKTRLQDTFSHIGVKEGRFTASQADGAYTPEMQREFTQWLKDNTDDMGKFFEDPKMAPSTEFIREFIKERESNPPSNLLKTQ